jgi:hypothetical protein
MRLWQFLTVIGVNWSFIMGVDVLVADGGGEVVVD